MVAELLGLPCVTAVSKLEVNGTAGTAERQVEGGVETLAFPLPALCTIDQGLVTQARYPSLKGIMAAKKKPLEASRRSSAPSRSASARWNCPPSAPPDASWVKVRPPFPN